jgi:hypothetical protein
MDAHGALKAPSASPVLPSRIPEIGRRVG